jgi:hypothetical protein
MEPTSLTPPPSDDDQIEAWLRSNAALPAIPDDGFSAQVMTALPPRSTPPSKATRQWFCTGGALAGIGVALAEMAGSADLPPNLATLEHELHRTLAQLATPAAGVAVVVTAASLLFVFWREIRIQLQPRIPSR